MAVTSERGSDPWAEQEEEAVTLGPASAPLDALQWPSADATPVEVDKACATFAASAMGLDPSHRPQYGPWADGLGWK